MKSNLYGEHLVDGTIVSKPTVINFFVDRALGDEMVTVYKPGTQARNFVHVKDIARVYLRSVERLLEQLEDGKTGVETYEVASDEDLSVMYVAETVREVAREVRSLDVDVELVENPRDGETMVEEFGVDTSAARKRLGWLPEEEVEESIRQLLLRSR
jgi:UDP-glucose 4-epimerase